MRLHENKEGDELQRLRARRQGTGRNYKNRPRQTKTVDHTYDEVITRRRLQTMNMEEKRIRTDWKFLLKTTTAAVQVFLTDIANIATKAGEKEKPATVIAHLELQEMWKLLHHQAKRVKPAETILVKHPESGKRQNGQLFF